MQVAPAKSVIVEGEGGMGSTGPQSLNYFWEMNSSHNNWVRVWARYQGVICP